MGTESRGRDRPSDLREWTLSAGRSRQTGAAHPTRDSASDPWKSLLTGVISSRSTLRLYSRMAWMVLPARAACMGVGMTYRKSCRGTGQQRERDCEKGSLASPSTDACAWHSTAFTTRIARC